MTRVGVFGGTFDPVHVGHLAIAHAALESVPLDRVLFVLARRSPLKERGPVASEGDRLRMLVLAVADEPRFAVSRLELDRDGPSYTVDTLERLAPASATPRSFASTRRGSTSARASFAPERPAGGRCGTLFRSPSCSTSRRAACTARRDQRR